MDEIIVLQKLLKVVDLYRDAYTGTTIVTISLLMRMIEKTIEELEDEAEQPEDPGDPF
jgi:hypothetical protein